MIKLRIDVDYPYSSRAKSFLSLVLKWKDEKGYLRNSKLLAKIVNASSLEVKAYWFFTFHTVPDRELLRLLHSDRHEIGLHVVKNPYAELNFLEKTTKMKVDYYTIHGTERLIARLMWGRGIREDSVAVPRDFPLKSFHDFPTLALDRLCYAHSPHEAVKIAVNSVVKGEVLEVHPEWLFRRGIINHRGPYYEALRRVLKVDGEMETLAVRRKGFVRIARDVDEYVKNVVPASEFLEKLCERGVDIFTFVERRWCFTVPRSEDGWLRASDNVALLRVATFEDWWGKVGKKTRNMVRKAQKAGIATRIVEPSRVLAEGIWRIYNETPVRQERAFPHYGISLETVARSVFSAGDSTFIGAFFQGELVGFLQLVHGDRVAVISQILSLQRHADKAVNNALIAKAVEVCAARKEEWLMYGRIGNHPSLDRFKQSNGFVKFDLTRYYVPLTVKGKVAAKLGLHRDLKDVLPESVKHFLIPVFNCVSRTGVKTKLLFQRMLGRSVRF